MPMSFLKTNFFIRHSTFTPSTDLFKVCHNKTLSKSSKNSFCLRRLSQRLSRNRCCFKPFKLLVFTSDSELFAAKDFLDTVECENTLHSAELF